MDSITIELRDKIPFENFKSIRFSLEFPQRITGHLIYIREDYPGYDLYKGDDIDAAIFNCIKGFSSKAEYSYQLTLITKQDVQHALHITRGGVEKESIFYFFPLTDFETYQRLSNQGELKSYPHVLKMTFWSENKALVNEIIPQEFLARIPLNAIDKLNTLRRI